MKAKKWVIVRNFQGEPKDGDLEIQEEELPELGTGDVLLEAQAWTVDPYMRGASNSLPPGSPMLGQQFARVTKSKNGEYPVGTPLMANIGWRSHAVLNPKNMKSNKYGATVVPTIIPAPDTGSLSKTTTLGILGMPGATAYFGFLEICKPQPGETVLVNGAAGAVGSLVGQIAKIKGCKVIGFAGSDDKVRHIKEDLGFDFAFNYKKIDVTDALKSAAPQGIDCYFDNVGGEFTTKVIVHHMNDYGRISICGSISTYNNDPTKLPAGSEVYTLILRKQLLIQGFLVYRWFDRFYDAWAEILQWVKEGKVKYREHVTDGFENMYSAFRGLLKGANIGKAVIKASSSDATKM